MARAPKIAMSADLLLENCRIPFGNTLIDGCIGIRSGRILYVGKETSAPSASEKINIKGYIILPGLCDVHTHLRDLHQSYKEDFYTGTCSALAGGFTTVLDMPIPEKPSESLRQLEDKIDSASSKIVTNVGFHSGYPTTPDALREVRKLGAFGLKIYMNRRENLDGGNDLALENALARAKEIDLPVAVHAEDLPAIERLEDVAKDSGCSSWKGFLMAHTPRTESTAVAKILSMVVKIGTRTHFCHLSTKQSVIHVRSAKTSGLPVSCEATPHHLFLTSKAMEVHGGKALMVPPLRSIEDCRAIWDGLVDGSIDLVASDHAPHTVDEKDASNIWNVPPGIPGLETTLPLLLTALNQGRLTLSRIQEVLANEPSRCFSLSSKGFIRAGLDADLVVIDIKRRFVVDPDRFHTRAKYSPFAGWKLIGKAVKTFVRGRLAMDEGEILAKPGSGSVLRREV